MALTCCFSPHITTRNSSLILNPLRNSSRLKQKHISIKRTPTLKIRSSFREKVFEDRSNGIICYTDESGEIVCEGFDEGPRYHQQIPIAASSRDAEIFDLLQQRWINFITDTELNPAEKGGVVQEDINCNGFNSLR
ncbi:hypothetical protein UlMin_012112 [Ulmus minor]